MESILKLDDQKNGSSNERHFTQNGSSRYTASNIKEIGTFRSALPQFLAVSVKNILLFVYGMTLGFPTIVIPAIQGGDGREPSDIVLSRDEISWFSSINLICVPLGCLFSGLLAQPIGKRRAMQLVNLPILASWLLFHFATKTEHLYAALCLSGLGGGLMEAPVLTYVAEITEPKYRGILSALGSTCVITGVFIQFIMGSLMDWRTIAAVSSAFPVISIIALCFVPESPTWLIREQRFREAVKALQWLRGWVPEHMIESEFNQLYDELITQPALEEAEEESHDVVKPSKCTKRMRLFRKRSFLVPFLLVAYTFFTGHFSGKTTLQTYAVQIFHTLKAPINKYHATILLGVAELIATIMCVFLIHFTGKRPLVLISTIGVGICFFGTATYAHYLKVVPGFAVNNVVVNASSIVPKENIIYQANITNIFANQEQHMLKALKDENRLEHDYADANDMVTTIPTSTDVDNPITTILLDTPKKQKREVISTENIDHDRGVGANFSIFTNFSNSSDSYEFPDSGEELTTTIPTPLDIVGQREAEPDSPLHINTTTSITTAPTPTTTTSSSASTTGDKIPSTKEVVSEILLPVPKQKRNKLVWIPLVLLLGSAFFAHLGIRMIPWILIGEVFPAPVRSTASGLVSGLGYIFGFLANKLFLQMLTTLTLPGTFWFYSAVALIGATVLYFILPETEGRTLAEIEAHFSKKSNYNLLSKSAKKTGLVDVASIQNPHNPIGAPKDIRIIQLQQSDLVPQQRSTGQSNLAFDNNSTTHL